MGVSMDAVAMSMTRGSNSAASGLASMTMHGAGLRHAGFTTMGRGGQTGCEGTEWESETSVRCMLGQGVRGSQVNMTQRGNRGGTGSALVTVHGACSSCLEHHHTFLSDGCHHKHGGTHEYCR